MTARTSSAVVRAPTSYAAAKARTSCAVARARTGAPAPLAPRSTAAAPASSSALGEIGRERVCELRGLGSSLVVHVLGRVGRQVIVREVVVLVDRAEVQIGRAHV